MAQRNIDFGSFPDDPDADAIRTAFQKVQENFTELYSGGMYSQVVSSINRTPGSGISVTSSTGNVIVSAKLAQVQMTTSTLSMGVGSNLGTGACVNSSSQIIYIDLPANVTGIYNLSVLPNSYTGTGTGNIYATNVNITSNVVTDNLTATNAFFTNANVSGTLGIAGNIEVDNANIANHLQVTGNANVTGNLTVQSNVSGANFTGTNAHFHNLSLAGNIIPNANITYDIGNNTNRFKDIYLANSTIYLGNATISANANAILFNNPAGGQLVVEGSNTVTLGNIASINLNGNTDTVLKGDGTWGVGGGGGGGSSISNGTSNIDILVANGNIDFTVNNISTATFTTTGNTHVFGNLNFSGNVPGVFITQTETEIFQTISDSQKNIYYCGYDNYTQDVSILYSLNQAGGVNWKSNISNVSPSNSESFIVSLNYNDNYLYAVTQYEGAPDYYNDMGVIQMYASNGNIANTWMINASNLSYIDTPSITFDSSGKPIVIGGLSDELQTDVVPAQAGSGMSTLIINNSDLTIAPYIISYGNYNWLIQTDPLDPAITNNPQYINWFFDCPVVSVTGIGYGMTIRIRYLYDYGSSTWSYQSPIIQTQGSDYVNGDQLKVLGSSIGGVDGVNDVTFNYYKPYWWYGAELISVVSGPVPSTVTSQTRFTMSQSVDYSAPSNWTVKQYLSGQGFIWTENWQHSYGEAFWQTFRDVKFDSFDNSIYITGQFETQSSTGYSAAVFKLDAATGNTIWAKYIVDGDAPGNEIVGTISVDGTGNSFLIMQNSNSYATVTKLDNSGNIVFQTVQQNTSNWYNYPTGGIADDGNIIVMGLSYNTLTSAYALSTMKLDKDTGSLIYARYLNLYTSDGQYYPLGYYDLDDYDWWYNIAGVINGSSMHYSCGYYLNTEHGVSITLPTDGSGIGLYGSWDYTDDTTAAWAVSANGFTASGSFNATDNDPLLPGSETVTTNLNFNPTYPPVISRIPGVGINNIVQLNFADGSVLDSAPLSNVINNGTTAIYIPDSNGNIEITVNGEVAGTIGDGVALGYYAGKDSNTISQRSIAIGSESAYNNQGTSAVAVGRSSGSYNQGNQSVAVGYNAGSWYQGNDAVSAGVNAGSSNQGNYSVAVGPAAGQTYQKELSVAIGSNAGQQYQGYGAVAIGRNAGSYQQGNYSIAIGFDAGSPNYAQSAMATNSIILNASGNYMTANTASLYVNPIRQDVSNTGNALYYNATTKEITYATAGGGGGSSGVLTISNISSTTTLTQALAGQMLRITSSVNNIVIPNDSQQTISQGSMYTIVNQSIGNPQITRNSGVVLYTAGGSNSNKSIAAYSVVQLYKVAANTWMVSGQSILN